MKRRLFILLSLIFFFGGGFLPEVFAHPLSKRPKRTCSNAVKDLARPSEEEPSDQDLQSAVGEFERPEKALKADPEDEADRESLDPDLEDGDEFGPEYEPLGKHDSLDTYVRTILSHEFPSDVVREADAQRYYEMRKKHFETLGISMDAAKGDIQAVNAIFAKIFQMDPEFAALEERIVRSNLRLVLYVMKRKSFNTPFYPMMDQIADGNIALWKAVRAFDPSMGKLAGYAFGKIWSALSNERQSNRRRVVSRSTVANRYEARMRELLSQGLENPAKIAKKLGLTVAQVKRALLEFERGHAVSMSQHSRDGEEVDGFEHAKEPALQISPDTGRSDHAFAGEELAAFRLTLKERDQLLLDEGMIKGRSAGEIAQDLGLARSGIRIQMLRLEHRLKKFLEKRKASLRQ